MSLTNSQQQLNDDCAADRAAELAAIDKMIEERFEEYTALRYMRKQLAQLQFGRNSPPEWAEIFFTALAPYNYKQPRRRPVKKTQDISYRAVKKVVTE